MIKYIVVYVILRRGLKEFHAGSLELCIDFSGVYPQVTKLSWQPYKKIEKKSTKAMIIKQFQDINMVFKSDLPGTQKVQDEIIKTIKSITKSHQIWIHTPSIDITDRDVPVYNCLGSEPIKLMVKDQTSLKKLLK